MNEAVLAAASALLGVALGGYIESRRSRDLFRVQKRAEYFEKERQVIRELAEVVSEHRHAYQLAIANSMGVLRGLAPDAMGSERIPWDRLKTLVALYAPELKAHVEKFDKTAGETGTRMVQARTGDALPEAKKQELLDRLGGHMNGLNAIYDEMERLIFVRAEELNRLVRQDAGLDPEPGRAAEA